MFLLLFYLFLAIGVSFLCSILEAVLLSVTPSYVATLREKGRPGSALLERLKQDVERPLAAILSLNTIAHTVGAAGVGAQAQIVFQSIPVTIISAVLTLLILFLSEIIPKTIGATHWRRLALPSAWVIRLLTVVLWPLVALSQALASLLGERAHSAEMSREEILALTDLGHREGVFDRAERKVMRGIMHFHAVRVESILTPRTVCFMLPAELTVGQALAEAGEPQHSRIPLYEGTRDAVTGYVLKHDLLAAAARGETGRSLRELSREVMYVPQTVSVKTLFGRLLRRREHIAIVVDEFGNFAGIVTMEDVIETLIGHEIMDEGDTVADLRQSAREASQARGG